MPSKFDRLRAGEVIEIEPGRKGRLNNETKHFETSDGRTMFVGNDPDFYPKDDNALAYSREKEELQREIKRAPAGEFLYQFGNQGVAGAAKDWMNRITKKGDEYLRSKQVNADVSNQISKESPWTSAAATAASFAPDLALTRGMSATKAAPALTALHSGSRIIDEPTQVGGEALASSAGGFLIDKGAAVLSRIAQRRAQSRALPGQQAAVAESNAQQTQAFNSLKQNTKNVNEARLKQHQDDLNMRQNNMINSQNSYEQSKAAREVEVVRLKNQAEIARSQRSSDAARLEAEYKSAKMAADQETKSLAEQFKKDQTEYQEALRKLPELQKRAQAEHSANVVKNTSQIEKMFPQNSRINSEELGVQNFIEDSINQSGVAGTREGSQARRVLSSLFPEGEMIGGRELSKKYKALEDSIQRATPEVQNILNNFKNHLGERLPRILENSVAYHKIMPLLQRTIKGDVNSVISELGVNPKAKTQLLKMAETNVSNSLKNNMTPANFIEKVQNGELASEIANSIMNVEDFLLDLSPHNIKHMKKAGTLPYLMSEAQTQHAYFLREMEQKIQNRLARYELKAMESAKNASQTFSKGVKNTYGLAEPVVPPSAPLAPNPVAAPIRPGELPLVPPTQFPPPIAPPQAPAMPGKPSLMSDPLAPIPQAMPTLPPAQGMAERTGDFLEKPILGRGNNSLLKLGGLKYLLGKAALPAEIAYGAMRGLTSPSSAGEAARMTFKQGGILAIDQWAQRYPSYRNGILENPMERRSLTKEIEDDSEIPIEQKAMMQSKVNRGKPIQDRL